MAISKRKLIYPIVVTLVFLGLLVIAAGYIQLRDIEVLRGTVVEQIRAQSKHDVEIGSVQLDFSEGIGVLLGRVTLKGASKQESDFTCEKVLVLLHWLPLLKGEIKIQGLIFDGLMVQVTRDDQGKFNFGDLSAVNASGNEVTQSATHRKSLFPQCIEIAPRVS